MAIKTLKSRFFTILLAAEIIYLTAALAIPPLPGWKMFSHIEWLSRVELYDDRGNAISLQAFLPSTHYEFGKELVDGVATFVCKKHPEVSQWSLIIDKESYVIQSHDCISYKK